MFSSIIIDDEPKIREVLKIKINENCPEIEILDMAENVEEALIKIKEHDPDLIFLDISMPGASGFDLLERIDSIDFEIIFVTGYNEYALDALKISAVDYILKPVKTGDLISAVEKASIRINDKTKIEQYELLKHNVKHIGDQKTKISIPGSDAYDFVKIEDILRLEGWNKYTRIHLVSGKVLLSSYNIGVFREMLESYHFYASHKSHVVNKSHIKRYLKEGLIVLSDGAKVPLARRRKDDFLNNEMKSILNNE